MGSVESLINETKESAFQWLAKGLVAACSVHVHDKAS